MRRFENKNVVITGAAEGLGQVIALEFAKEGARLLLVDQVAPEKTLQKLKGIAAEASYILCDISREDHVLAMGKEAGKKCDKIDILVNNAGYNGKTQLVKDMKLEDWQYTLDVNLTGTMLVTREIIPYMVRHKSGHILNVASNEAKRGLPFRADYVCSKWALIGLTQTLALELAEHNVRVNAVCPGPVEGKRIEQLVRMHAEAEGVPFEEMHKAWKNVPMKRFVKPEEVAHVIRFLCSDDSSAMTGQALNVTGGFLMD